MSHIVPARFLFRWSFAVPFVPELGASALSTSFEMPVSSRWPQLTEFDGQPSFAELFLGWNHDGFAVAVQVQGKQQPIACDVKNPTQSDGLQVWIDTRCTQKVHRASRFCHAFSILPQGKGARLGAVVIPRAVAQAREAGALSAEGIEAHATRTDDGYRLDCWFPARSLAGFEPSAHPRLGFYAIVHDQELGEQFLTVGRDFPVDFDPSMWQTLELAGAE